jgi:hypothetical protein
MNFSDRIDRLQTLRREHRLIRNKWVDKDADGQELACLLAALSPEVGEAEAADACPADVVTDWFAHLTPWIDDAGSKGAWEAMVSRYVAIVSAWQTLTPERDRCLKYAVRALCVREAMRHTSDASVLAVCQRVALLCEGVAAGGAIDSEAFVEAEEASAAAEAAAASSAASRAATSAATASSWAAASREAASWATSSAAASASWATSSRAAAEWATAEAAADRLIDAILGACERELGIAKEGRC